VIRIKKFHGSVVCVDNRRHSDSVRMEQQRTKVRIQLPERPNVVPNQYGSRPKGRKFLGKFRLPLTETYLVIYIVRVKQSSSDCPEPEQLRRNWLGSRIPWSRGEAVPSGCSLPGEDRGLGPRTVVRNCHGLSLIANRCCRDTPIDSGCGIRIES